MGSVVRAFMKYAAAGIVVAGAAVAGGCACCAECQMDDDGERAALSEEAGFEMRQYQLVLLKKGPAWSAERTAEAAEIQKGHLANIGRLAESGEMVLAGPMGAKAGDPDDPVRGVFIMACGSEEACRELLASDPAIASGRLRAEILDWWAIDGITYPGDPTP